MMAQKMYEFSSLMRVLGRRGSKRQDHRSLDDKEKKTKGKCHPLSWKEDQKPSFKIFSLVLEMITFFLVLSHNICMPFVF